MVTDKIEHVSRQIQSFQSFISERVKTIQDLVTKCLNIIKKHERLLSSLLALLVKAVDNQVNVTLEFIPIIRSQILNYIVIDKYIIFDLQFDTVNITRENLSLNLSDRIETVYVPFEQGGVFEIPSKRLFHYSSQYPMFKDALYIVNENEAKAYVLGIPDMRHFSLNPSPSDSLLTASKFVRAVGLINLVYNLDKLIEIANSLIPRATESVRKTVEKVEKLSSEDIYSLLFKLD